MEKTEFKKIDFGRIASSSFDWAYKITFSPFSLKKIFILAFVAWLGAGVQGCNIPFLPKHTVREETAMPISPGIAAHKKSFAPIPSIKVNDPNIQKNPIKLPSGQHWDLNYSLYPAAMSLVVFVITLIVAFIFVFTWVSARFSFIFLDNTIKNDASIHNPFYRYKQEGNSLFIFNFLWGAVFLLLICAVIIKMAANPALDFFPTEMTAAIIMQHIPLAIVLFTIISATVLFFTFTYDFAVPIMYHNRISILPAWKIVFSLLKKRKKDVLLYLILKLGLTICATILAVAAYLIAAVIIALIGLAGGLIFYFMGQLAIKTIPFIAYFFYALAIVTGIIFLFLLCALFLVVMVPIALFFRIFSVKFIEIAGDNYNFFPQQDTPIGRL